MVTVLRVEKTIGQWYVDKVTYDFDTRIHRVVFKVDSKELPVRFESLDVFLKRPELRDVVLEILILIHRREWVDPVDTFSRLKRDIYIMLDQLEG
jgi:hypothetical protein